jgi:hypothetical protein
VDKRQNTTASDRSPHEGVELLVPPYRKLQVPRRDALDTEILRRVAFIRKKTAMSTETNVEPKKKSKTPRTGKKRGVPASSRTSAVRYSRMAEVYTAAFAPMRTLFCVSCLQVSANMVNRKLGSVHVQHRSAPTRSATGDMTDLKAGLRATCLEDFCFGRGGFANFGLATLRAFR